MPYHPDHPTASVAALAFVDTPESTLNTSKTGVKYATFPANPLMDKAGSETPLTPPVPQRLITKAEWEELQSYRTDRQFSDILKEFGMPRVYEWVSLIDAELAEPGAIDTTAAKRRAASKRRVGALSTPALVRKEMAALYRETYLGEPDAARNHTRMMYMLDCLLRATRAEQKHGKAAGDDVHDNTGQTEAG